MKKNEKKNESKRLVEYSVILVLHHIILYSMLYEANLIQIVDKARSSEIGDDSKTNMDSYNHCRARELYQPLCLQSFIRLHHLYFSCDHKKRTRHNLNELSRVEETMAAYSRVARRLCTFTLCYVPRPRVRHKRREQMWCWCLVWPFTGPCPSCESFTSTVGGLPCLPILKSSSVVQSMVLMFI